MKKFLIALLCLLPTLAGADEVDTKYLCGAVPEVDGAIIFADTVPLQNMDADKALTIVTEHVQKTLLEPAIQDIRTRMISDGKDDGTVVFRVEEYMIFKRKPLYLDRTRFRYVLTANVQAGNLYVSIRQISYYYNEGMDGKNGEVYKAEEWISDKEAVNKNNTKLYPRSGKFRRKTIDRVEEIFDGIRKAVSGE